MKLLVLGGTKFLGRQVVELALALGHEVTTFNRGRTNADLFGGEVEKLIGDRDGDLRALEGRTWDAVVDPSGYVPRVVRASAELLTGSVGQYVFVSSISVYASFAGPVTEDAPVAPLGEHSADELAADYANYGPLKALCEQVVSELFPARHANIRAGLIVGPHDPTGRFTYWPHRIARGGDVLVPAPPERRVQFIDVRDLAGWMLDLCERRQSGTYNATNDGVAWGELVETCRDVSASDARFVWVPDEFLAAHAVGEWMELPLWLADPEWVGMHQAEVGRAIAAGLTTRPLADTVRATLDQAQPTESAGLLPDREAQLLDAWRAQAPA